MKRYSATTVGDFHDIDVLVSKRYDNIIHGGFKKKQKTTTTQNCITFISGQSFGMHTFKKPIRLSNFMLFCMYTQTDYLGTELLKVS